MPKFSVDVLTFIKNYGAMYVSVNMRGGGEFGEEWHLAGTKEKKVWPTVYVRSVFDYPSR